MSEGSGVDLRFLQANERTFLAWVRTGLALAGFGFVVAKSGSLLEALGVDHNPDSAYIWAGACLVGVGALAEMLAVTRFLATRRALLRGAPPPTGAVLPTLLGLTLAMFSVGLTAWLLTHL